MMVSDRRKEYELQRDDLLLWQRECIDRVTRGLSCIGTYMARSFRLILWIAHCSRLRLGNSLQLLGLYAKYSLGFRILSMHNSSHSFPPNMFKR